jgi:alpha-galactosidase
MKFSFKDKLNSKGEAMTTQVKTPTHTIFLECKPGPFTARLSVSQIEPGLDEIHLRLEAAALAYPPAVKLTWTHPAKAVHSHWSPTIWNNRGLDSYWGEAYSPTYVSRATSGAPVLALLDFDGTNRLTMAFSDALNPVALGAGLQEETLTFICSVRLFAERVQPLKVYEASLRLDTRELPFYESLRQMQAWWAAMPLFTPSPVPELARLPMYSTWYSFHQAVTSAEVESECRLAKGLGCEAVIVDDGWQTADNSRGYAYCGDWEVEPTKIPDMRAHVSRVHELGMAYMLWFSVPFVGKYSKAFARFKGRYLRPDGSGDWFVLDPRFPEVRAYLIGLYERAVKEWDVDGLKLDFVDAFTLPEDPGMTLAEGQDTISVPEAVDRLLTDTLARLRQIKPDVLVEFRQSYIGPVMRRYGNMFRAADCPGDALTNRVRTLDIRLICGATAAHADMLAWHVTDPVESAALQFINTLFAVPQVSMRFDLLPPEHLEMIHFMLSFWRDQRDVLLDGTLIPYHPEAFYPQVQAITERKFLAAAYTDCLIKLPGRQPAELILVNGTPEDRLVLDLDGDAGQWIKQVRDCRGRLVVMEPVHLARGLNAIPVPPSGVVLMSRDNG